MRCELCGERILGKAYLGLVDRATLILCSKCVKRASKIYSVLGASTRSTGSEHRRRAAVRYVQRRRYSYDESEEVVPDYADRIRKARERAGLTRDALAAMLGVKVSVVRRMEEGTLMPTLELARKLERILRVKLLEPFVEEPGEGGDRIDWEQTLGDIVEFKD